MGHTVTPIDTPQRAGRVVTQGVGETGTIASPPAIVNAVVDALSHLDIWHRHPTAGLAAEHLESHSAGQGRWWTVDFPPRSNTERAETVDDAVKLLEQSGGDAPELIAGGHSLLPLMRLRLSTPSLLPIDIGPALDISSTSARPATWWRMPGAVQRMRGELAQNSRSGAAQPVRGARLWPGGRPRRFRAPRGHRRLGGPRRPQRRSRPSALLALDAEIVAHGPGGGWSRTIHRPASSSRRCSRNGAPAERRS